MLNWIIAAVNWTNISSNWAEWVTQSYTNVIGEVWFYPLMLVGIIGYVYAVSHSATAAGVAIALIFGIFGVTGVLSDVPELAMLSWGVVVASFSAAFVAIFTGRKK